MKAAVFSRNAVLALGMAAFAVTAVAQQPKFEPSVGQPGKDVVWVPTSQALVDAMMKIAKVTASDIHYDLGSGDGRTVITAAKIGARAYGIEYNPDMVTLSQKNAQAAGVTGKATFVKADIFETDLSKATVITMFLLPQINLKLRPKILDMKPGTRIVSNTFTMEDWQPDQSETIQGDCVSWCTALLWIVPAKVDGAWKLGNGELTLKQTFQMLDGTLKTASGVQEVKGKVRGEEAMFTAGGKAYRARVVMVSPMLLMATVQLVQHIRKDQRMREAADQIQAEVGRLLKDVGLLGDRVRKLQTHFNQSNEDIRQAIISVEKIESRGGRITQVEVGDDADTSNVIPAPVRKIQAGEF